jgi:hydroxyacylglutathione hydrolase
MDITTVPCLGDNYAYLVQSPDGPESLVVDPGSAAPAVRALRSQNLQLVAILSTHHHFDHTGGNGALLQQLGQVPVYGHVSERQAIPGLGEPLEDGAEFEVAGLSIRALHVPGHTRGAVAYLSGDAVFTGDTLFVAGCGRVFEGTFSQMHASLSKLAALPAGTRVYCGHEYTARNLEFALSVEPGNAAARAKSKRVAEQRRRREPTVPSSMGEELETNPFLRGDSAEIRANLRTQIGAWPASEQVFAALRAAKDRF